MRVSSTTSARGLAWRLWLHCEAEVKSFCTRMVLGKVLRTVLVLGMMLVDKVKG